MCMVFINSDLTKNKTIQNIATQGKLLIQEVENLSKDAQGSFGISPSFASGSRSFIMLSGTPLFCMSLNYSISIQTEELRTIDQYLPVDITNGQVSVKASLQGIIDPFDSFGKTIDFPIMASIGHKKLIELQIMDVNGVTQMLVRGMFISLSSGVRIGELCTWNAEFQGIMYQDNTYQNFIPYSNNKTDLLNKISSKLKSFKSPF